MGGGASRTARREREEALGSARLASEMTDSSAPTDAFGLRTHKPSKPLRHVPLQHPQRARRRHQQRGVQGRRRQGRRSAGEGGRPRAAPPARPHSSAQIFAACTAALTGRARPATQASKLDLHRVAEPKRAVNVDSVDRPDVSNAQACVPYLEEIHRLYRETEARAPATPRVTFPHSMHKHTRGSHKHPCTAPDAGRQHCYAAKKDADGSGRWPSLQS